MPGETSLSPVDSESKRPLSWAWAALAVPLSVFIFFAGQLIGAIPLFILSALLGYRDIYDEGSVTLNFILVLCVEIVTVLLLAGFMLVLRIKPKMIGLVRSKLIDFALAIAGYVAYFLVYIVVAVVIQKFTSVVDFNQEQELGFNNAVSGLGLLPVFISLVVLPPIVEELLVRGFLYSGLRNKLRPILATLITSILFAAAHLQWGSGAPLLWVAAIDIFILSVVLCYLREKTGRLAAPMMLHAIKNGVAFAALFIFKIS